MASNVIFFGWDRPVPGREMISAQLFQEFMNYLGGLQAQGTIQSFESVFLNSHGGDLGGFTLIHGEPSRLDALTGSDEWEAYETRAAIYLEGTGVVRGATGDAIMQRMALYTSLLPT